MTWEGVPWMIGGGAEHSAEVGRLLAYAASGNKEGVVGPTDCKVVASGVPDGNIHIQPGAVSILNRFAGGGQQSYMARNVGDTVKAMTPQGSSGVRYDLVAVIVEDPQYPGQPAPADVQDGPYIKTKVYENVASTVKKLSEVAPNIAGYALARVKFDASDGTVSPVDITDLRSLVIPRTQVIKKIASPPGTNALPTAWGIASPPGASWSIDVPDWATRVILEAHWAGVQFVDGGTGAGSAGGYCRATLGTLVTDQVIWQADASGTSKPVTEAMMSASDLVVPSIMRGTSQTLRAEIDRTALASMTAQTTVATSVLVTATFYETVE
jgi:hypothetical protein